jgi:two-component system, cell cycle sensor histidine kinase and response regulator CckA
MRSPLSDRPTTALVVDDEEPVRRFVSTALHRAGYEVTIGCDGPDALKIAESSAPFDMVVTDLLMPGMTGDELARQLRQRWPALRVLYLTGHADRLFAQRLTLWEGEAFLDKPCEVKALLEAAAMLMYEHLPASLQPPPDEREPESPEPWRLMKRRSDWSWWRD